MSEAKKKIIFVITKGNWGGAQRYVYDLTTALPAGRFEPLVVAGDGGELVSKLSTAGIACRQLPSFGRDVKIFNDLKTFRALYQLFKLERPDIIHLNSSKIGGLGALAAFFYNLKAKSLPDGKAGYKLKAIIIFTAHGWAFNEARPLWQKVAIKFLSWLTILLCHQIIVINQKEFDQVKAWPGARKKLVLIYNGIKPINFLPQAAARRELRVTLDGGRQGLPLESLPPETVWLGTIAELHRNKGLEHLIQALSLSRLNLDGQGLTLTTVIIGEGEERKNLERQIKTSGLTDKVFLVGAAPEAARYLRAFDIFILPSLKEGLPYTILEAGLAGLPVIASAVGGIPEIITSMASGILIRPRDPREIARVLKFLISEPKIRHELGAALRRKVKVEFSTARMVKQTLAIYN